MQHGNSLYYVSDFLYWNYSFTKITMIFTLEKVNKTYKCLPSTSREKLVPDSPERSNRHLSVSRASILITLAVGWTLSIALPGCKSRPQKSTVGFDTPRIDFSPKQYICYHTSTPLDVDGVLDEKGWQDAQWSEYFVDITGSPHLKPPLRTRMKMLWDDEYIYVGSYMEEPHLQAAITTRDAVIFHDNDFEMFIDPDGDTHEYCELEINAFGTCWDLFLTKPYRDGGTAVDAWDIQGLQSAIHIDGTLNQPQDRDRGWSVEIAVPWRVLRQVAHRPCPPGEGDRWRINFSRVEWQWEISNGKYRKKIDPESGLPLPEQNWVWSPQGLINMHYPEMWGFVQFSRHEPDGNPAPLRWNLEEEVKWALRLVYYEQRSHFTQYGVFSEDINDPQLMRSSVDGYTWPPVIRHTRNLFEATVTEKRTGRTISIDQDGDLWWNRKR
jgi:hypothetical protein